MWTFSSQMGLEGRFIGFSKFATRVQTRVPGDLMPDMDRRRLTGDQKKKNLPRLSRRALQETCREQGRAKLRINPLAGTIHAD